MHLANIIKEKALELGFTEAGITTPEPFHLYEGELSLRGEMFEWGKRLSQGTSVRDIDLYNYVDPRKFSPETKSILVVTDSYFEKDFPSSLTGRIGRCYLKGTFAKGETVHARRRKKFSEFLQGLGINVLRGTTPVRMAGARAGVTNYGRNCFAYAKNGVGKSSWVVIESYLVDQELTIDEPTMFVDCPESCRKCMEACPTNALYAPMKMDPRRCIAYHTYFNINEIPREIRPKMGTWIYGCDICQEVCPRNKGWLEKEKEMDLVLLDRSQTLGISSLLQMTQENYERHVWPLLYYIRKENLRLWKRNASVALGNQGDSDSVPLLIASLEDPEPLVRGHVAWALGKIGGKAARDALERRRDLESNERVSLEIEEALRGNN